MSAADEARTATWEGQPEDELALRWGVPGVVAYERLGSTSDTARALADDGAASGTLVIADFQDAGRGRQGARWDAPPGRGLLLSMVLRPRLPPGGEALLVTLPLRIGLAVGHAIEGIIGRPAGIKWPNDVLLGGAKVAGVLCESALGGRDPLVIVGVGINVGQRSSELPPIEQGSATSLTLASGAPVARLRVADRVVPELLEFARVTLGPLEPRLQARLAERDALRGRRISVDDGRIRGVAAGIEPDGALVVRTDEGDEIRLTTGTVRHIRPPLHLAP